MNPRDGSRSVRSPLTTRFATLAAAAIALALLAPAARAENTAPTNFVATTSAPRTTVYAGPGKNYYIVGELVQGAAVKVDSVNEGWAKIVPPNGAFSYISKAFVVSRGDSKTGTVNVEKADVKAPAPTGPADSYRKQLTLTKNDTVKILGEEGSFYKIAPPPGAFLYLAPGTFESPALKADPAKSDVTATPVTDLPKSATAVAQQQPAQPPRPVVVAPPATQPATDAATAAKLADLEKQFRAAITLPLENQPIDKLTQAYQALESAPGLTSADKKLIADRLSHLARNAELRGALTDLKTMREDAAKPVERPAATQPATAATKKSPNYNVTGRLITSGVYDGTNLPRLYRIVEPATLQTLAYVAPGPNVDPIASLGKLVGIIGETRFEPAVRLQVINVKKLDILEPSDTPTAPAP